MYTGEGALQGLRGLGKWLPVVLVVLGHIQALARLPEQRHIDKHRSHREHRGQVPL